MDIHTKFGLDDVVFYITDTDFYEDIDCEACNKIGKITFSNIPGDFICPVCKGQSKHPQYRGRHWLVVGKGIIGKVSYNLIIASLADKEPEEITYMLHQTGVGFGTIWDERNLFRTKEEAQAECDRRNEL